MPDGAPPDVRFGNLVHLNCRHHSRRHALLLKRVLERERVDDRCEHAHVVAGHTVHVSCGGGYASKEISSADDKADLHFGPSHFRDFGRQTLHALGIEADDGRANAERCAKCPSSNHFSR